MKITPDSLYQKAQQRASPLSLWIGISLFWGTVLYATSIYMMNTAGQWLNAGTFVPPAVDLFHSFSIYTVFVVLLAVVARRINQQLDPTGEKRVQRQREVLQGKTERMFVSFVGSVASGFAFAVLTGLSFSAAALVFSSTVVPELRVVLSGSVGNMAAGIAGSAVVGIVLVILKVTGNLPVTETP